MKLSVLALALVSIAALSSTAVRADVRDVETATVTLQGVDMNDAASVAKLYQRLERAAQKVCDSDIRNVTRIAAEDQACARQALDEAVEASRNKRLIALHAERTGGSTLASGRTDKSELDD